MPALGRVLLWLATLVLAAGCAGGGSAPSAGLATTPPVTADTSGLVAPPGMPTIAREDLPVEAAATLALMAAGGPYPYRQDGAVFQNREGLLPDRPKAHYREYTVETPGSDDRGARRIIAGADGELYWTDDHYRSFAWILP